jgi:hypothetical protein
MTTKGWRWLFRRRNILQGAIVIALYVGSYLPLSATGDWYYSQTGDHRYGFGLAMSDIIRWQPRWASWEPFRDVEGHRTSRGNPLGYLYSPLIRLDRKWFHQDRDIFPGVKW